MKRAVVLGMARLDELADEVLYRPAVVKAFGWLPRWWLCDLAKVSMRLDDRWQVGYWADAGIEPGGPCSACGRRAAIHVIDAPNGTEVGLCGWCHVEGAIMTEEDLQRELTAARRESVAWRWRWHPGRR